MSFAKCKKQYGITLKRGGEVEVISLGKKGVIKSYRNYVSVRHVDGSEGIYHPFDLKYLYSTEDLQGKCDKRVERFNKRLAEVWIFLTT